MDQEKAWNVFVEALETNKSALSDRDNVFYIQNPVLNELNVFMISSLERILYLYEDTIFLLKNNRILSASITARSLFEGICMLMEFQRKIKACVQKGNYKNFKVTLTNFTFASKEFESIKTGSLPNVMDAIRNSEKTIKNSLLIYGILCEAVHPNWAGRIAVKFDQMGRDPVTLRLYISIMSLSSFLKECFGQTLLFDDFMNKNKKNIKNMLLDFN
jgi:hypothetical protein